MLEISHSENVMHPHDYLLAVLISLTQPVVYGITAPLGIDGILKEKLGYIFHFSDMEEMRTRGMSVPDGLVFNSENKILLIPECKSALQEDNETALRLLRQIKCYSSEDFLEIVHHMIPDFQNTEIVIITFDNVAKEIELFIKSHQKELGEILNIIVWAVSRVPKTDQLLIRKFYGTHIDNRLGKTMTKGVYCKSPAREFLSSPDIPDQRFASVLGRRFLVSIVTGVRILSVEQIMQENPDLALSFLRLRRILKGLFSLIPILGTYNRRTDQIRLKTKIDFSAVQHELLEIGKMSKREYRRALGMPEEKPEVIAEELKPTKQVKLNEFK